MKSERLVIGGLILIVTLVVVQKEFDFRNKYP